MVVGCLTILASLLGYAGSQFRPQLLLAFLIVGAIGAVAQLIIVLAIFFAQPEVATAIENMNTQGSITAAYIKEKDRLFFEHMRLAFLHCCSTCDTWADR